MIWARGQEDPGTSRLWWWVCFSGAVHILIIATVLFVPPSTARRRIPYPVYTVDLVGGAPLQGEAVPAAKPTPSGPPEEPRSEEAVPEDVDDPVTDVSMPDAPKPKPLETEPPKPAESEVVKPLQVQPAPEPAKEETEKKVTETKVLEKKVAEKKAPEKKVEKPKQKKVEKKAVKPRKKRVKKTVRKPRTKAKENRSLSTKARENVKRDELARQRLREKRIQAAVAKAKERAAKRGQIPAGGGADIPQRVARGGGAGDRGAGAGFGDATGSGGGVVKSLEFVIYRNRMLNQIKSRWTWVGKRTDLQVTVRFGVDSGGEIFALEIVGTSGDASYDDSVVRALKRASPLPPPPARHVGDFSDVELTFRPKDLSG